MRERVEEELHQSRRRRGRKGEGLGFWVLRKGCDGLATGLEKRNWDDASKQARKEGRKEGDAPWAEEENAQVHRMEIGEGISARASIQDLLAFGSM